jgi:hypothetical protein
MDDATAAILEILASAESSAPNIGPTVLYNEGWLLRLLLHTAARGVDCLPFRFAPGARWFSEALLHSPFLPRHRGDPEGESRTHADGLVGHFHFDQTKSGAVLDADADQFIVCEAKIFSGLSKGTTRAPGYDQAARTIACMASMLTETGGSGDAMKSLGFYVFAPQQQFDRGVFGDLMTPDSIRRKVARRIARYDDDCRKLRLEPWSERWLSPLLNRLDLQIVSWESVIVRIKNSDRRWGDTVQDFYSRTLRYCAAIQNRSRSDGSSLISNV